MSCDNSTHNTTGKCGRNVTIQETEVDMMSQVTSGPPCREGGGVDVKSLDVATGCQNVTGNKCHFGPKLQWTFRGGPNVTRTFRGWTGPSRYPIIDNMRKTSHVSSI